MQNLKNAMEKIKALECPSGELENRVHQILENCGADPKNITIRRNEFSDKDGIKAYTAKIKDDSKQDIVILAKTGLDDYVTTVVDTYLS